MWCMVYILNSPSKIFKRGWWCVGDLVLYLEKVTLELGLICQIMKKKNDTHTRSSLAFHTVSFTFHKEHLAFFFYYLHWIYCLYFAWQTKIKNIENIWYFSMHIPKCFQNFHDHHHHSTKPHNILDLSIPLPHSLLDIYYIYTGN